MQQRIKPSKVPVLGALTLSWGDRQHISMVRRSLPKKVTFEYRTRKKMGKMQGMHNPGIRGDSKCKGPEEGCA
jgi:hypothetical protein